MAFGENDSCKAETFTADRFHFGINPQMCCCTEHALRQDARGGRGRSSYREADVCGSVGRLIALLLLVHSEDDAVFLF